MFVEEAIEFHASYRRELDLSWKCCSSRFVCELDQERKMGWWITRILTTHYFPESVAPERNLTATERQAPFLKRQRCLQVPFCFVS